MKTEPLAHPPVVLPYVVAEARDPATVELSLDAINAIVLENERAAAVKAAAAEKAEAQRALTEKTITDRFAGLASELAGALRVSVADLPSAIRRLEVGHAKPVALELLEVCGYRSVAEVPGRIVRVVRAWRVLAGCRIVPEPTAPIALSIAEDLLRDPLPAFDASDPAPCQPVVPHLYRLWMGSLGIPIAGEIPFPPPFDPEAEARVADRRARKVYDPNNAKRNDQLAGTELTLVKQKRSEERAAHRPHRATIEQRAAIVAAADEALAKRPLDLGWWWLREMRRYLAGEATITEIAPTDGFERVWAVCVMLGAAFDVPRPGKTAG